MDISKEKGGHAIISAQNHNQSSSIRHKSVKSILGRNIDDIEAEKKAALQSYHKKKQDISKNFPPLPSQSMAQLKNDIKEIEENNTTADALDKKRTLAKKYFASDALINGLSDLYIQHALLQRNTDGNVIGVKSPSPDNKEISIVGGVPGSGKSTILKSLEKEKGNKFVMVDPDFLVTLHPQFENIKELFGAQWGEVSTVINRPCRKNIINKLCEKEYQICVEGSKSFASYIPDALEKDYAVHVHIPTVPPALSQQRSVQRLVDQKQSDDPLRGITKEEYEDKKGHHALAKKSMYDLFKAYEDHMVSSTTGQKPRIQVTLHTTDLQGNIDREAVRTFQEYNNVYDRLTSGTDNADDHIKHLENSDQKAMAMKHLERVAATYKRLEKTGGSMKEVSQFLPTMGVTVVGKINGFPFDNDDVKFFGNPFPALGSQVPRGWEETKKALDIHADGTVFTPILKKTMDKYTLI